MAKAATHRRAAIHHRVDIHHKAAIHRKVAIHRKAAIHRAVSTYLSTLLVRFIYFKVIFDDSHYLQVTHKEATPRKAVATHHRAAILHKVAPLVTVAKILKQKVLVSPMPAFEEDSYEKSTQF